MVAPINIAQNVQPVQNTPQTQTTPTETKALDSFSNSGSTQDVAAFQSSVQNAVAQNVNMSAGVSADMMAENSIVGSAIAGSVNFIQDERKRIDGFMAKGTRITQGEVIKLQVSMEEFTISTQLLSKTITTISKTVDTLVHMQ